MSAHPSEGIARMPRRRSPRRPSHVGANPLDTGAGPEHTDAMHEHRSSPFRTVLAALAVTLMVGVLPATAGAVSGTVTLFPTTTADAHPFGITQGPDGAVWFTQKNLVPKPIGRIAADGTITEFATDAGSAPEAITTGPDGNLWYTDGNKVGRMTPAGVATVFNGFGIIGARGIAAGPDGNLWVVDGQGDQLVAVKPDGTKADAVSFPTTGANAQQITRGPDGNMWFTTSNTDKVGRLNLNVTPHTITEFPIAAGSGARGIAVGPDGKIWFAESNLKKIGRMSTDGTGYQESGTTIAPTSDPEGIAAGRDGAMWISIFNGRQIGRMDTGLALTQFATAAPADMGPRYIAQGADGNMWFTDETHSAIGRITVDAPVVTPPPVDPPPTADTTRPVVSKLKLSASTFVVGSAFTAKVAKAKAKRPIGTDIRFRLSEDATVSIAIERAQTGRRQGSSCRKPSKANRKGKRCTRYTLSGTLRREGRTGANAVAFSGRVGTKPLAAGKYRVAVTARDAAGNGTAKTVRAGFTVARHR